MQILANAIYSLTNNDWNFAPEVSKRHVSQQASFESIPIVAGAASAWHAAVSNLERRKSIGAIDD